MADEKFRLPRNSYDQLTRIIQAYGQFNVEATLDEVANIAGTQRTVVSANNGFFSDVGVLSGGNKKSLTDRGRALARALEYDNAEEVQRLWREAILDTDFFRSVLSAVRIRRGMEPSNLQSHIAYSAGLAKNQGVMTGAAAVIDILEVAGLLRDDDGTLVAIASEDVEARDVSVGPVSNLVPVATGTNARVGARGYVPRASSSAGDVQLHIQIQIQCSPDELDGLGEKLKGLLAELNQPEPAGE
jgi:hypothetical protein